MLNSVSFSLNNINMHKSAFPVQQDSKVVSAPINNINFRSSEILASYNAPLINKSEDKFNIPILEPQIPNDTKNIKGEKIYTSDGKLDSIVDKRENKRYIYKPNEFGTELCIYDLKTNKLLFTQFNNNDGRKFLYNYDKFGGFDYVCSQYENDKPVMTTVQNLKADGSYENRTHYFDDNSFDINKFDAKTDTSVTEYYDKNKQLTEKLTYKYTDDGISRNIQTYSNGIQISNEYKELRASGINNGYQHLLDDKDLIPAKFPNIPDNINNINGQKTYYSNGNIESVKTQDGTIYKLSSDGESITIINNNTEVEYVHEQNEARYRCQILEKFNDGNKKQTLYMVNEKTLKPQLFNVMFYSDNDKNYKGKYYENGRLSSYDKAINNKVVFGIDFTKNGSVMRVYNNPDERDL